MMIKNGKHIQNYQDLLNMKQLDVRDIEIVDNILILEARNYIIEKASFDELY